jgi:DNA-binding MarR family transcriptional regulator
MKPQDMHDPADAADCVCFNLRKATRSITHIYDAALRPSGLRATQFTVLNVIQRLAPAGVTKIADVSVIDRTTLTRSLALLERDGLVRLVPSEDVRERLYVLTNRGERALQRAAPLWDAAQARVIDILGATRVRRLLGDLETVVHTGRVAKAERVRHAAQRRRV